MAGIASRFKWIFGKAATTTDGTGASNNVLGSTGAGVAFNTHGWGAQFTFTIETDGSATCSYQIRRARTSAGPWSVLSSGTLSTGAADTVQLPGPLGWLSPRVKTINSTANQVVVRMEANE